MYDMMVRKKALKIQERLGFRMGIAYGTHRKPVIKTTRECIDVLNELYKMGLKAFILPKELFSDISNPNDLYKAKYGDLLKIRDVAAKLNIELALRLPKVSSDPDNQLQIFCNIAAIMDARMFIIPPNFYPNMPLEQSLKLVIYKINEIVNSLRTKCPIGIETTGKMNEVGSLEDVLEIIERTTSTEPVINWGNIHARHAGALTTQDDYKRIVQAVNREIGLGWGQKAYFIFSGVSYGPSGLRRQVPLKQSDMKLDYMIREAMSNNMKGTLIFDDPDKDRLILNMMNDLADMVR